MPKKFVGENTKAAAARSRKQAAKEAEDAKKQKDADDALWKDDDKQLARKQQRKEEAERKKQEALQKKANAKSLLEEEMKGIQSETAGKQPLAKVTRAQIQAENEKREAVALKLKDKEPQTHIDKPLEENINRLIVEGDAARTIDEAIAVLSVKDADLDKHPEKRLKAAYTAFEEKTMPLLKEENPNLRLSQVKQLLRKEWMKSPDNPMNQLYKNN